MLNRLLTSPTIRTFLRPTPLTMPTQFLKKPMGTRMELKNSLEGGPFTYFKFSSNRTHSSIPYKHAIWIYDAKQY